MKINMKNNKMYQRMNHRITIWCNNSTSGYIHKTIESRVSEKSLHGSMIHNSKNVEVTQVSITKLVDMQNVGYIFIVEYYAALKR